MKSFNSLLKKRVQKNKELSFDIHLIKQTVDYVLLDLFGKIGEKNIKVKNWDGKVVTLSISKSVWRNEVSLLKNKIIFQTNKKLNQKVVKYIKINQ